MRKNSLPTHTPSLVMPIPTGGRSCAKAIEIILHSSADNAVQRQKEQGNKHKPKCAAVYILHLLTSTTHNK